MVPFLSSIKRAIKLIFLRPDITNFGASYDNYWEDVRGPQIGFVINSFQAFRARFILNRVSDSESLLDIGSGDGAVLKAVRADFKGKIFATDVSDVALDVLEKQGFDTLRFDINNVLSVKNVPTVDHISILEVLEHIPNPELLLIELLPKVRRSIFISVPNSGYYAYRLRLMLGRFPMQWVSHPGEHLRFWTYDDFKWWLNQMKLGDHYDLVGYEGVAGLNVIFPSLFAEALIVEVRLDK